MIKHILILSSGILFGAGLALSGMIDPAKVIGFLDFTGAWQPGLAFVMGGAVGVFGIGLFLLKKFGQPVCKTLPDTSADPISKTMVVGSAIFGIGWGLGGFCPGPAIANLAMFRSEALIFLPCMLVGMFVAQRLFRLDQ